MRANVCLRLLATLYVFFRGERKLGNFYYWKKGVTNRIQMLFRQLISLKITTLPDQLATLLLYIYGHSVHTIERFAVISGILQVYNQHIPGEKSAIGQTRLLFCLTGSKKQTNKKPQHIESRVCVCVCVCVCV